MFGPIDWNRFLSYLGVASLYLLSLLMLFKTAGDGQLVFALVFLFSTAINGSVLLTRLGDGIFISENSH